MVSQSVPINSSYLSIYKQWISTKPQVIGDIESTIRCLSYFTAGRFSNSSLASEFIYSMPNLLILLNDRLIYSIKYKHLKLPEFQSQIRIWLTIIEYTEALFEVTAKKLWGNYGKWIIIFIIQSVKAILRLLLVHKNKERIVQNPAIPPLNREKLNKIIRNEHIPKEGYQLKRTGAVVRSVHYPGPLETGQWSKLTPLYGDEYNVDSPDPSSLKNLMISETLYIMKPLIHLTTLMVKGNKNWLPWATALTLDAFSLYIISKESKNVKYNNDEKQEIIKRKINLLLYILRSPFYDNCSKDKINSLLSSMSNTVPFARFITDPVAKYLPHWQKTYFYMWSS
ncbi:peroxisomal membrane protein PEX16 [Microplitis demolitor]|uniref:peroxisomal membrane protein PEX16 n=1 Tax=Microplitis demolitor TaxID=69319 RepID=UPI0004CDA261|nr:peroxisomal membrane protein PEX16 [Microplitis demolitor]